VIERPRDAGAAAIGKLADAVAARYGIPAASLRERLSAGRLRVKSNLDREAAETWATDLESLGAVCAVIDTASGEPVPRPRKPPPPSHGYSSGLAAAFSPTSSQPELGAIGDGALSVSTLDGVDDRDAAASDPSMLPASFGPAAVIGRAGAGPVGEAVGDGVAGAEPTGAPAARPWIDDRPPPSPPSADQFAPPESTAPIDLDLDVAPRSAPKRTPLPAPPPAFVAAPAAAQAAPGGGGLAARVADPRIRLGAGVLLAILLGFVPALIVHGIREGSAFDKIDRNVEAQFELVDDEASWEALTPMLARERARKEEARRDIALGSMLIWALCGGAIAYAFFRKIDWDRVVERLER
jgi:hypothetical protein